MKKIQKHAARAVAAALVVSLSACAGMSARERNMIGGAASGGGAGSVLTNGSALGTVGGAAVGGVIGNEIGKNKQRR